MKFVLMLVGLALVLLGYWFDRMHALALIA